MDHTVYLDHVRQNGVNGLNIGLSKDPRFNAQFVCAGIVVASLSKELDSHAHYSSLPSCSNWDLLLVGDDFAGPT